MSEWCQTGWGKAAVAVYCRPEPRGSIDWLCWAEIYANPVAYAVMTSLDNLGRCLREASGLAVIEQRGARCGRGDDRPADGAVATPIQATVNERLHHQG